MEESFKISALLDIYGYDAYLLRCAQIYNAPLLSLDKKLIEKAAQLQIEQVEVEP